MATYKEAAELAIVARQYKLTADAVIAAKAAIEAREGPAETPEAEEKQFRETDVAAYLADYPSDIYSRNEMLMALGYPAGDRSFSQPLTWCMKAHGYTLQWAENRNGNPDTSDTTYVNTGKLA